MTRILYASDLHREFKRGTPTPPDPSEYDMVVLAGDIDKGARGLAWAEATFDAPVVYVPGNHEYYGFDYDDTNAALEATEALFPDRLKVLQCGSTVIQGVRFIGATLWTDLRDPGVSPHQQADYDAYVERNISDFDVIWRARRKWRADDARGVYEVHSGFIGAMLAQRHDGPTVVVTHFLPTREAIATKYAGSSLNGYFANSLDALMDGYQPRAWIFGHTHEVQRFHHRSGVECCCNPFGYPGENAERSWKILEV
jgi:Icc-related predicted phosphoesterase